MKFGKNKNSILIYISSFLLILGSFFLLDNTFGEDLMEKAFESAMSRDTVINLGNNKRSVGNNLLKESKEIGISEAAFSPACFNPETNSIINKINKEEDCKVAGGKRGTEFWEISRKAPLIVRITKLLLRITIALSISMIIFNSIKYMMEVLGGKDWKSAESKKNLIFIAGGIVLALMSVSIINLIVSVPKSSLKTSDDLSSYQIGCRVGSEILAGDDLKKRICENSTFGHPHYTIDYRKWDPDRMVNRCWFPDDSAFENGELKNDDGEWKAITNSEMKGKCKDDLGGEVL